MERADSAGMSTLPWLYYDGETTDELLACGGSHRVDSLVAAFEGAIQLKPEQSRTPEERVVLAVEALEREVNNGGFLQFLDNTPEYASIIVDSLRAIGASTAAQLAADAIAGQDSELKLETCDERYYNEVGELADDLFAFIQAHAGQITI